LPEALAALIILMAPFHSLCQQAVSKKDGSENLDPSPSFVSKLVICLQSIIEMRNIRKHMCYNHWKAMLIY